MDYYMIAKGYSQFESRNEVVIESQSEITI